MPFLETITKTKIAAVLALAIFLIILDRGFKTLSIFNTPQSFSICPGLNFAYQLNHNIAFSLPVNGDWLPFTILILILIFLSLNFYWQKKYQSALLLLLIILPASSNLYDRFRYGGVIDYLHFFNFSVLNLADIMISIAICGLFLHLYLPSKKINLKT